LISLEKKRNKIRELFFLKREKRKKRKREKREKEKKRKREKEKKRKRKKKKKKIPEPFGPMIAVRVGRKGPIT
jgi:septal ring factor EnvC (AmiA/AmiB activator)